MSNGKRSKIVFAVETGLALAIVAAVVWYFWKALAAMPPVPVTVRPELLVLAGVCYLLAHLCWSAFWVRLLHYEGVHVSWWVGLRTYYISQFGKYIPGKVWVPAMRMGMLRPHGAHPVPVGVTAVYETLTSMAAGALLAVLFLPALGVLPPQIKDNHTALFAVAALPIGLAVLNKLAARIAKKKRGPDARPLPAPSLFLLAQGLLHGAAGYTLLALSLGLTIRAVLPNAPAWTAEAYSVEMAAVALAYVAGFVIAVAPGGLGVREFVLAAALTPAFTPALGAEAATGMAILVALVLRLTWSVAEVAVGGLLYVKKPKWTYPTLPHPAAFVPIANESTHA